MIIKFRIWWWGNQHSLSSWTQCDHKGPSRREARGLELEKVICDVQFSSVAQLYPTLWDPMDCSTPGFPVHQLPELAQTHVHWVHDAIQQSHPLSSPSPPAFSLSQHQGLFQWVSSWHQWSKIGVSASASVLPMNIQDWFPLGLTGFISLLSKGLSRVFSRTTIQRHRLFSIQLFMVQLSHPYMTSGKTTALTRWTFVDKVMFCFLMCCVGLS